MKNLISTTETGATPSSGGDCVSDRYRDPDHVARLRASFLARDYVKLPAFLTETAFAVLKAEVLRLESSASARSFVMDGYATPRHLKTIGGSKIAAESPLLSAFYADPGVRAAIEGMAGRRVFACKHPEEFLVANYLTETGATHGWHLDDPAFALILFFESPPPQEGGLLELIRNWHAICARAGASPSEEVDRVVDACRKAGRIQVKSHAAGDAYLLRADRVLHRVTELTAPGARRSVINLAYEATLNPAYGVTATKLYGG